MRSTPVLCALKLSAVAGISFFGASLCGCASAVSEQPPPGAKIVNGDAYVILDAPVGSHLKRKIKVSDLNQPGIAPVESTKVTSETNTTVMPPTAGEMQRMLNGPIGGR